MSIPLLSSCRRGIHSRATCARVLLLTLLRGICFLRGSHLPGGNACLASTGPETAADASGCSASRALRWRRGSFGLWCGGATENIAVRGWGLHGGSGGLRGRAIRLVRAECAAARRRRRRC